MRPGAIPWTEENTIRMKRALWWIGAGMIAGYAFTKRDCCRRPKRPTNLPLIRTEEERRILEVIDRAREAGEEYANVPDNDGRMLRLLIEAVNAQSVVEVGTSTGFSGLWLAMALEKTGGRLTTFELDAGRAAIARKNFREAGVDALVTIIEGDAHDQIASLNGPVDVVFIDPSDKDGYNDYLDKLLPLVRPGGLILAHNITVADTYAERVQSAPELETLIYSGGRGLSITLKKR